MIEFLIDIDKQLFLFINGLHSNFMDIIMWQISATYTWAPLYLLLIVLMIKTVGLKKSGIALLFVILAIVLADQGSVHFFKNVFMRLRPSHNVDFDGIIHLVKNKKGGTYGFISSHASNTFMAAIFFSLLLKNKFIIVSLLIWATIIAYSRIYLGVHYPADVIAGAMYGGLVGTLFYYLFKLTERKLFRY